MKKTFLLVGFLLLFGTILAQVPGYMGKRFQIHAGIHVFPQVLTFPVNVVQPYQTYFISGVNYKLALGTDFVVSRKSSIGLVGHYFNTAATPGGFGADYTFRYAVEGGSVGAVFKTHFGPWIAPLGPYFKAEAGAIFMAVSDPLNNYSGSFLPQTFTNGYIGAGFGRAHIFANRISLDYGGEMAMVFPPYNDGTILGSTNVRMTIHYAASVYVKIGVII